MSSEPTSRRRIITAVATLAVVASGLAIAGDGLGRTPVPPGKSNVPNGSWPHQTGVVAGTSETFTNMREDGSYYDPSLGRRVARN
jgi:hypothetical protein